MNIGQLTMWVLQFEGLYREPKPLTIEDQEFVIST
jgi:hypothetical protein